MRRFICKKGASNYYLVNDGMGGFLNPPNHPEHTYSIQEFRGGHECGSYSLGSAAESDWMPGAVRGTAKGVLKRWKIGEPDESWLASVYNYFRHCYRREDGTEVTYGNFWGNAEQEQSENPLNHRAYQFVKQFYPDHQPDLERIAGNDPRGQWSTP
jgi:aryl-phospho-beta-D-glucosidase BglC (GH1 family)